MSDPRHSANRLSVLALTSISLFLAQCSDDGEKPRVAYGQSVQATAAEAVAEAWGQLKANLEDQDPGLVIVSSVGAKYDANEILTALTTSLPAGTMLWGYTSHERGVFLPSGLEPKAIGLLGLAYPGMEVGIGMADYATGSEPGRAAIEAAIANAGKSPQEVPTLILVTGPSGANETAVLEGIESVVGSAVPIVGGNATGLRPEGTLGERNYFQFARSGVTQDKVSVAVIYGEFKVAAHFGYYHDPVSEQNGLATEADPAQSKLMTIGGQPAAEVYNGWLDGAFDEALAQARQEPDPTTITWLSSDVWAAHSIKMPVTSDEYGPYIMTGPVGLYNDGSAQLCCHPIEQGKRLTHMTFNVDRAASAAADFADAARLTSGIGKNDIAGILFVYCDSPFLVHPEIGTEVTQRVQQQYGADLPFVGMISAGEMGYTRASGNWFVAFSAVSIVFSK